MISAFLSEIFSYLNSIYFPLTIGVICLVSFITLYSIANHEVNKYRREVQAKIKRDFFIQGPKKDYNVAYSGIISSNCAAKASTIDIELCVFLDSKGKPLNINEYQCFIVLGNALGYTGIHNNGLIFVAKDLSISSLVSFPEHIVLKHYSPFELVTPLYIVCRAWDKGTIEDNFEEIAQRIVEMPKFHKLTQQTGYMGSEWMTRDLIGKRLNEYKTLYLQGNKYPDSYRDIIVTTILDTERNQIHFSIEPICHIVGKVIEAYDLFPQNLEHSV